MCAKQHDAEVALEMRSGVGESPVWDDRRGELLFVDMVRASVHRFSPATGSTRSFDVPFPVSCVALRQDDDGLILAGGRSFFVVDRDGAQLSSFGEFRLLAEDVAFNDGKVDPRGRLVVGSMDERGERPTGALYMLEADGSVRVLLEQVTISNGLAWSLAGDTCYFIDSVCHLVEAFDVDAESGRLSNRRAVTAIADSVPDGMAIDAEGLLWVACWGGGRVDRIDPATGTVCETIPLPVSQVASVAFGGDALDQLFITTARDGLDAGQLELEDHAGDLFVAIPGARGLPTCRFGLRAEQTR